MTVIIAVFSIWINIRSERKSLDDNLKNIAQAVAQSSIVRSKLLANDNEVDSLTCAYLDTMKHSMSNIDVISLVDIRNIRHYHTNKDLINTVYDGSVPVFSEHGYSSYVENSTGPSGAQRRAYAPVYDNDGNYCGFVIAVMLDKSFNRIIINTIFVHLVCFICVVLFAVVLSVILTKRIKNRLHGFEPDTFNAMFSIRDNILESLEEGIVASDKKENIIYMNKAAKVMLSGQKDPASGLALKNTIEMGEKTQHLPLSFIKNADIIADNIPVIDNGNIEGALCILRDQTEMTRIAEDLSGVKFLVESMRANNHDFTNKLHVILGLIQMNRNQEACEYITKLSSVQQSFIHRIMKNIEEPTVSALLIGKYSRAAELDVEFILEKDSCLRRNDISLTSGDLVTIIGNLIENALDSLNLKNSSPKQLTVGIYTKPDAMIINVDDTGSGIETENMNKIFSNGFSTKGENRGTGLFIVNELVKKYNGTITVESEPGVGSSFTVTLLG
ncbi:MAG: ATP-binding protein [Lachnospiraceae bacterium]|nr:ATP-binding protein [Lachnospiraceae bacterium]